RLLPQDVRARQRRLDAIADHPERLRFDGGTFLDQRAEHGAGFAPGPFAGHDGGAEAGEPDLTRRGEHGAADLLGLVLEVVQHASFSFVADRAKRFAHRSNVPAPVRAITLIALAPSLATGAR